MGGGASVVVVDAWNAHAASPVMAAHLPTYLRVVCPRVPLLCGGRADVTHA